GADLRRANLRGASFQDTRLHGADLRDARMGGVNLKHTSFHGANLRGAYLRVAKFHRTDLSGADLRDVEWLTTGQIIHTIRDAHTRLPLDLITEAEDGE
ncbi:MAG: pentapeptide repeat-containing protein, partial [Alphaproteobacteria bacterium]|nr:pentapeptide repeat-containing protein [Alphaproteobacteria bacterium]